MKNFLLSIVLIFGFANFSSATCITENPMRVGASANQTDSAVSQSLDPCIPVVTVVGTLPGGFVWGTNGNKGGPGGSFPTPSCRQPCFDDLSRGTAQIEGAGRQPGCLDEQLYMAAVIASVSANGPIGTFLNMGAFNNPQFSDPNWQKWATSTIKKVSSAPWAYRLNFRMEVHYMYNTYTHEIAETKLKNSFEYGCVGIVTAI